MITNEERRFLLQKEMETMPDGEGKRTLQELLDDKQTYEQKKELLNEVEKLTAIPVKNRNRRQNRKLTKLIDKMDKTSFALYPDLSFKANMLIVSMIRDFNPNDPNIAHLVEMTQLMYEADNDEGTPVERMEKLRQAGTKMGEFLGIDTPFGESPQPNSK